ncbi:MAG: hypothetical protein JKY36_08610, partial [Erythrobacter sp.]|nr:hypothetical protein [Erythrobacter sp.]
YNCESLDELTRQMIFSPADMRARQVKRIERLHDQLDEAKNSASMANTRRQLASAKFSGSFAAAAAICD